jgi:predicted metal-dependent phosphoesterase TrpH
MLLADFHIHTTWSDGKLSIPEVVDLFGRAGHDVIAITDHVVNADTLVGKATHCFGLTVTPQNFPAYREEIEREKKRALDQYGMVVIPGFELTQNAVTRRNSAHVLALGVDEFISADGTVEEMLERAQRQSRIVVACHPHEQSDWFSNTFYLWNRRNDLAHLVDLWEVACRFDLFPPVARARLPYIGNSDFHRVEHLYAWKTLVPARKNELAIFRALEQGTGLGVTRLAAPFTEVSA